MAKTRVAFFGGDRRMVRAASFLEDRGFRVLRGWMGEGEPPPAAFSCDVAVLPVQTSRDGQTLSAPLHGAPVPLDALLERLTGRHILTGRLPARYAARGVDYSARDDFARLNAVPTAEGALQLAMEHLPVTIHGCRVLITGFGRIARATAERFCRLGAAVTVAARSREARAEAFRLGYAVLDTAEMAPVLPAFPLVINTVPARLFTPEMLGPETLYLELASAPFGLDPAAEERGVRLLPAGGLPGRVAPDTAGDIVGMTVLKILSEMGVSSET